MIATMTEVHHDCPTCGESVPCDIVFYRHPNGCVELEGAEVARIEHNYPLPQCPHTALSRWLWSPAGSDWCLEVIA